MHAFLARQGFDVYLGNASVLAVINFVKAKDALTLAGNACLIVGTLIFTYYKIRKMREEQLKARAERIKAEHDAGIEQSPD